MIGKLTAGQTSERPLPNLAMFISILLEEVMANRKV